LKLGNLYNDKGKFCRQHVIAGVVGADVGIFNVGIEFLERPVSSSFFVADFLGISVRLTAGILAYTLNFAYILHVSVYPFSGSETGLTGLRSPMSVQCCVFAG
jgi:hypothetical protein